MSAPSIARQGSAGTTVGGLPAYRLLLPAGWARVVLVDDARRTRDVRRLVARAAGGGDVPQRWRLHDELARAAADGAARGGVELHACLDTAGLVPLAATLVVTLLPAAPRPWLADALVAAWESSTAADDDRHVTVEAGVVKLAVGPAARRRFWRTDVADASRLRSVVVEHVLPVPGTTRALLLTGASPLPQLANPMGRLFDTVAGTLEWLR